MDTVFETQRLRVRPWKESDAKALFRYASEPEVGERAGWPPHESIEDSIKVIREVFSNGHTFAMELKEGAEARPEPVKGFRLDDRLPLRIISKASSLKPESVRIATFF